MTLAERPTLDHEEAHAHDAHGPVAVIAPGHTYSSVTDQISSIVLTRKSPPGWLIGFAIGGLGVTVLMYTIGWLLIRGVGIWGIEIPVGWGFDIINFVWWIGIGHAGTLISAVLLLLRQEWRTSINRFAEAMTLFAVACAGLYPLLHMGRPWRFYYLFPYPNSMAMWPQWRSPLMWDVFAVSTYGTVSLLFWYVGLIPDLATLRDRSRNKVGQFVYGMMSMGWRGSARHWSRYQVAYLLLAGLATPLVVSVHTIVSFDFAVSLIPGWHSTIFPPYFVAGAILSGFAMVLTLAIPLRKMYGLEDFITQRHLNAMALVMLGTGLIVGYGYLMEVFMAWYSGNIFEQYVAWNRAFGPYWWCWWGLLTCNVFFVNWLWSATVRNNVYILFVLSIIINIGMWLERFLIIVTSLHRDFVPGSWGMYTPTRWDWSMYLGTIGLFLFLFFAFIRVLPVISIAEMRELVSEKEGPIDASDDGDSYRPTDFFDAPRPAYTSVAMLLGEAGEADVPIPPPPTLAPPVGEPAPFFRPELSDMMGFGGSALSDSMSGMPEPMGRPEQVQQQPQQPPVADRPEPPELPEAGVHT